MQSTAIAEGYEFQGRERRRQAQQRRFFSMYLELDSIENSSQTLTQRDARKAASELDFERAAELRDRIWELEALRKIKKAPNIIDKESRIHTGTLP